MTTVWKYRHIAMYQEGAEGAILGRWALLNIECDTRAKGYWSVLKMGGRRKQYGTTKGMRKVRIHGMAVGTNLIQYLRKSIQSGDIFDYWVDVKKRIWDSSVGKIDWEAQGKALGVYSRTR